MPAESTVIVESHRSAATLYAAGELMTAAVMDMMATAEQLPEDVRALCIDLRGVRKVDSRAMRALETGLRRWRACRRGMSRVKLPEDADRSLVALQYTHQRWTPPPRNHLPPPRERFRVRMRDSRQAAVTRSLRERAGSETR